MSGKSFPIMFALMVKDLAQKDFAGAVEKMQRRAARIPKIKDPNEQARQKMLDRAEQMSTLGKRLTVGLTLPIVAAGAASERMAANFEASMANIATVIDTNAESLDKIGARVLSLGKRMPVELGQLTAALYDIRSAGIDASSQFQVLEGSAKLAVAGLGTVEESTDLVTSAINAFQLKGAAAQRVYNNIFAAVQFGKTKISGLAQGFGSVAATVAASGTELDEYLSMVAALTTTGQPASEAHTQLKAVLSGLTRTSKETSAVFRQLGVKDLPTLIQQSGGLMPALESIVSTTGMGPKFTEAIRKAGAKDFPELVKQAGGVEEALDRLGPAGKANASKLLQLVGSTEALNAIISLTGPVADKQRETLDGMRKSTDLLDTAFAKQDATSNARMQKARNNLEAAGIVIGTRLLPHVTRAAEKVADLADKFSQLSETKQSLILWGAAAAMALGPLLTALGSAVRLAGLLKAGTAAAGAASAAGAAGSGAAAAGAAGGAAGVGLGTLAAGAAVVGVAGYGAYLAYQNSAANREYNYGQTSGARLADSMRAADEAKIQQSLGLPAVEGTIKVDFSGLPAGARVTSDAKGPVGLGLNLGYAMPPG